MTTTDTFRPGDPVEVFVHNNGCWQQATVERIHPSGDIWIRYTPRWGGNQGFYRPDQLRRWERG